MKEDPDVRLTDNELAEKYQVYATKMAWRLRGYSLKHESYSEIEDLAQVALLSVIKHRHKYHVGGNAKFSTFAFGVMKHSILNEVRNTSWQKRSKVQAPFAYEPEGDWWHPSDEDLSLEMEMEVAGLTENERLTVLGLMAGYNFADIARTRGVVGSTVKHWRNKAAIKLGIEHEKINEEARAHWIKTDPKTAGRLV